MVRLVVLVAVAALSPCLADFVPVTLYEQTRRSESSGNHPKPSRDEDPNAHRLRESVSTTKIQQVYEEKGFEDEGYDHGHLDEHGKHYHDYTRRVRDSHEGSRQTDVEPRQPSSSPNEPKASSSYNKEFIHSEEDRAEDKKSYSDGYDNSYENYEEDDDDDEHYDRDEKDDEDIDYPEATIPSNLDEENPKFNKDFIKWKNKEFPNLRKEFEKWQNKKEGSNSHKKMPKWKNNVKEEGKNKEGPNPNMLYGKMKKNRLDKNNFFKYQPIKVPYTAINGLSPFRPLVLSGKVIYPGRIINNKMKFHYSLLGMPSSNIMSVSSYPYRRIPSTLQSVPNDHQSTFRPSTSKRSPNYVRFPNSPAAVGNLPAAYPLNQISTYERSPNKNITLVTEHFPTVRATRPGIIPIVSRDIAHPQSKNPKYQQSTRPDRMNVKNTLKSTPQTSYTTKENSNVQKSKGRESIAIENSGSASSVKNETESKPQSLNRGHVKYIERLTASHYSAPKPKESFKPVPKTKQERINELAKKLNSDNSWNDFRQNTIQKRRLGRTRIENNSEKIKPEENKYPFYKRTPESVISEDSPLNYIRNPKLRPNKTPNNMVLYPSNDPNPCSDQELSDDVLPKRNSDGEWVGNRNSNGPKLTGVAGRIRCNKNKYFGQEPLDNPLFSEIKKDDMKRDHPENRSKGIRIKRSDLSQKENKEHVDIPCTEKSQRCKRDVDLSRYHVVITRQNRRPVIEYDDEEEEDTKTEETSHAETTTTAVTETTKGVIEETTTLRQPSSTQQDVKPVVEKKKEEISSEEESIEKVIPVMTRPVRRMSRPRHAYSSRYMMSSTRRTFASADPEPTPAEETSSEDKKIALKQRIKYMTSRPIKFSLLPGNTKDLVERVRVSSTTTEPTTTEEASSSTTARMYPPKRKLLKLRKGPFNMFSVLNEGKTSATTRFPVTHLYNEAKMSSSETVESYEEHRINPSETVVEERPTTHSPPKEIKSRRPLISLSIRENKVKNQASGSNGENHRSESTPAGSSRPNRSSGKERGKYNKKVRAVEVEVHQVDVHKIEPIEGLGDIFQPMIPEFGGTTSVDKLISTNTKTDNANNKANDTLVYSINAATGTGTWKKYKDKTNRGKVRNRIEPLIETAAAPTEESEPSHHELQEEQQEKQDNIQKRRRRPSSNSNSVRDITRKQASVVGLMNRVMPKDVNSWGLEEQAAPRSAEDSTVSEDSRTVGVVQEENETNEHANSNNYSEDDSGSRMAQVVVSTTTTEEPTWRKQEVTVRVSDSPRRRKPVLGREDQQWRKPIRTTEEPQWKRTVLITEVPRWRILSSTTELPQWKQSPVTEEQHLRESLVSTEQTKWQAVTTEQPHWQEYVVTETSPWKQSTETEEQTWRVSSPATEEPAWKSVTTDVPHWKKSLNSLRFQSLDKRRNHQPKVVEEDESESETDERTIPPSIQRFNFEFQEPTYQEQTPNHPPIETLQIFDPNLLPLINKPNVSRYHSESAVEDVSEAPNEPEDTPEPPKVKKPMHIIRKAKPNRNQINSNSDDTTDNASEKSPSSRLEGLEKRRRTNMKNKSKENNSGSEGTVRYIVSSQESKDDPTSDMTNRRKMFLKNLLRPSMDRHKSTEQSDAQPAESAPKWIKDPSQRSYFYIND